MPTYLKYNLMALCVYIVGAAAAQDLKSDLSAVYAAYSNADCIAMSGKIQSFDLSIASPKLESSQKFDYVKNKNNFWYAVDRFITVLENDVFLVVDNKSKQISIGESSSKSIIKSPTDISRVDSLIKMATSISFIGEKQGLKQYQINLPARQLYYRVDLALNMNDNTIRSITQFQKSEVLESHIKVVLEFEKVSLDKVVELPQTLATFVNKSNKTWKLSAKYQDYQLIPQAQNPKK